MYNIYIKNYIFLRLCGLHSLLRNNQDGKPLYVAMVHRHLEWIKNVNEDHPWKASKHRNKKFAFLNTREL